MYIIYIPKILVFNNKHNIYNCIINNMVIIGYIIKYSVRIYVKGAYVIGRRSTNTIEGYWSHLKKMISGTHFWVSRKHLQRYVDCESFRYNTKHLSESERFDVFLQNTKRRLRYSQLKKITA